MLCRIKASVGYVPPHRHKVEALLGRPVELPVCQHRRRSRVSRTSQFAYQAPVALVCGLYFSWKTSITVDFAGTDTE